MIIYILYYLVFKILSSLVRDSSYHDMYYKGCELLCAHKKPFNTAIPVRSLGPYMYVHYCTCIVHILVWTYLFPLTSFFDCLSFCGLFFKHPYKRFFPFYILYFYLSRFISSLDITPNHHTINNLREKLTVIYIIGRDVASSTPSRQTYQREVST